MSPEADNERRDRQEAAVLVRLARPVHRPRPTTNGAADKKLQCSCGSLSPFNSLLEMLLQISDSLPHGLNLTHDMNDGAPAVELEDYAPDADALVQARAGPREAIFSWACFARRRRFFG